MFLKNRKYSCAKKINYAQNHILAWQMDPVYPIWTKFGRNVLLNSRNKLTEEFLTHRKIQDGGPGRHYRKLRNRL